jgi:hypothetical protein
LPGLHETSDGKSCTGLYMMYNNKLWTLTFTLSVNRLRNSKPSFTALAQYSKVTVLIDFNTEPFTFSSLQYILNEFSRLLTSKSASQNNCISTADLDLPRLSLRNLKYKTCALIYIWGKFRDSLRESE